MSATHVTVTPAYGRDYKTQKAVVRDWEFGLDFQLQPAGCYCSIRDVDALKDDGYTHIHIRFKQRTKVCVIKL